MKKVAIDVIKRPRITEKAAYSSELSNAYVFEIDANANKANVATAIKDLYNVTPIKVNIVKLPAKKVLSKGKRGKTSRVKKAYVYLKKGDKIEIA